jgi:hypothetical protein
MTAVQLNDPFLVEPTELGILSHGASPAVGVRSFSARESISWVNLKNSVVI